MQLGRAPPSQGPTKGTPGLGLPEDPPSSAQNWGQGEDTDASLRHLLRVAEGGGRERGSAEPVTVLDVSVGPGPGAAGRCTTAQKSNGHLHFILFERDSRCKRAPRGREFCSLPWSWLQGDRRGATPEAATPSSLHPHRLRFWGKPRPHANEATRGPRPPPDWTPSVVSPAPSPEQASASGPASTSATPHSQAPAIRDARGDPTQLSRSLPGHAGSHRGRLFRFNSFSYNRLPERAYGQGITAARGALPCWCFHQRPPCCGRQEPARGPAGSPDRGPAV